MKSTDIYAAIILFSIAIISRIPFVEKMMSHTDASSLVLGLIRYDLLQETPPAPGYPVYFAIGYIINHFLQDPYLALISVSVIFSGFCVIAIYFAGKSLGGRGVGLIASSIFLSIPTFYFFGITVYPYIVVITFLTLLVWCVHEIVFNKHQRFVSLGIIYALLLGVRPQELMTTLPLFIFGFYFLNINNKIKSLFVFFVIMLAWILPFLQTIGGLNFYLNVSVKTASVALPFPSLTYFISKKFELMSNFYLTAGFGTIILIIYIISLLFKYHKINYNFLFHNYIKQIIFFLVWLGPVTFFNLFIRTEHAGYQALYLIFIIFAISYSILMLFKTKILITLVTGLIIVSNLYLFFHNRDPENLKPYRQSSFHYTDLRRNEYELSSKVNYIKNNYNSNSVLIIAGPYFWRHARYYLPDYLIIMPQLMVLDDKKIFIAKNYKFKEIESMDSEIKLSDEINKIIFFDNDAGEWASNKGKLIPFKGSAKMIELSVDDKDKIIFSKNKINLE